MRSQRVRAAAAVVAMAAGGCGAKVETPPAPDGRSTVVELPEKVNRDLDLLVVMDDSVGLIEIQTSLNNALPVLLDRLREVPGGLPNLHVGIVSTDMGTQASGSAMPGPPIGTVGNGGCAGTGKNGALQLNIASTDVSGRFLSDIGQGDGTRLTNYTGSLMVTLAGMISAGAGGCGFEQPLAAMRAALDGHPENAGFLRQEALLGVLFVADEDDCSAVTASLFDSNASGQLGQLASFRCTRFGVTCAAGGETPAAMNQAGVKGECGPSPSGDVIEPVEPFRDFLLGLKADPRQIAVAGIVAPPDPVVVELRSPPVGGAQVPALAHGCSFTGPTGVLVADPAVRLHGFIGGFGDRGVAPTVCNQDLSGAAGKVGGLFARALGSPCVDGVIADTDPGEAGVQDDCVVEDVAGELATKPTAIDRCDASEQPPCWKLAADAAACGAPGNLKLVVVRDGAPAPGTVARMRCTIEP